jgi:hypothetical protein
LRTTLILLGVTLGCAGRPATGPQPPPPLSVERIVPLIPPRVTDRPAWAQAVHDGLLANELPPDASAVCAVLAIIGQESGFQEDPAVPGLAKVVEARLERLQGRLGPLGRPLVGRLLAGRSPDNPRSFGERLHTVRTERDLDVVFRDLLTYYQAGHPIAFDFATLAGKLFDLQTLADLNPITTAGPMQVSVRFSEQWARDHRGQPATVRDALYTRAGGVYYGTARLFAHPARYDRMLFRFADYNAGVYASRNAAVQARLSRLVGRKLALDGDLLSYGKDGEPRDESQSLEAVKLFRDRFRSDLSDRRLRQDLLEEKTAAFESTETYRAIEAAGAGVYAIVPEVMLESPKLSRPRSTAWFAQAVDRRYRTCLAAIGP